MMEKRKSNTNKLEFFFKKATAKNVFPQAEYWYILSNKDHIMSYKNYNISNADELYVNNRQ